MMPTPAKLIRASRIGVWLTRGRLPASPTCAFLIAFTAIYCLAAIHWAKVARVVYGATIADAAAAGYSELSVPAAELARMGGSPLRVEAGPLRDECRDLFRLWRETGLSPPY